MGEPTLLLAVAAGVVSFLSPCMLPVIPAFLAQLAGSSLGCADLRRRDLFSSTVFFVVGFSVVFAVLGVLVNAILQGAATEVVTWLSRVAGVVVIVLGLHLTGLLRIPVLDRNYSVQHSAPPVASRAGHFTSLLFGASFAVAWTPCVGPVLGSTLALAAASPASAFPLLLAYAFGLGTPFLLVGFFPGRAFAFIKRHRRGAHYVHLAFGFVLIGMGVLVFTNKLSLLANFQILNGVFL